MTIVFSCITKSLIITSVDSSITTFYSDHNEYSTTYKYFYINGVGCVTTWGERRRNNFTSYLNEPNIRSQLTSVQHLREYLWKYLTEIFQPKDHNLDIVGYHISGFENGFPRHYSLQWSPNTRKSDEPIENYDYHDFDCYKNGPGILLNYDGRFDIAHTLMQAFIKEINSGHDTRFNLTSESGKIRLSDFIIRIASELTPEVGPPFYTFIIFPNNEIKIIINNEFIPLSDEQICIALDRK